MNISFAFLLFMCFAIDCNYVVGKPNSEEIPTGSVLFHDKTCWLHEDLVLLSSRKTMQNLIPTNLQDVDNDSFIIILIDYFRMCFSTVQKMSTGRSQDILLLALADAIGGYLHHYVIPITKQSFYSGNVRYDYAKKLYMFYDQICAHLDTSGKLWTKPIDPSKIPIKIHKLTVRPPANNEDPCSVLLLNEKAGGKPGGLIPIPYLDDYESPTAIAVPFRSSSLRKLCSAGGAFVLEKYYVTSSQCLISRSSSCEIIAGFNNKFHAWLVDAVRMSTPVVTSQTVLPHLHDDVWYPAFGGVLKIMETMKEYNKGANRVEWNDTSRSANNVADNLKQPTTADLDKEISHQDDVEPPEGAQDEIIKWSMLTAIGLGVLTAWICGVILCICMRCTKRGKKQQRLDIDIKADEEGGYQFINTFVQVIYDMKDNVHNLMGLKSPNDSSSQLNKNSGDTILRTSVEDGMSVDIDIHRSQVESKKLNSPAKQDRQKTDSAIKMVKTRSAPLPKLNSSLEVRQFSVQSDVYEDHDGGTYRSRDSSDLSDMSFTHSEGDTSSEAGTELDCAISK